jgi:hypothetical protein
MPSLLIKKLFTVTEISEPPVHGSLAFMMNDLKESGYNGENDLY